MARVPLWLKIGWSIWVLVWAPAYALHFGTENFLWFCNLANFGVAAALWIESPLLLSWQAVSVLLVQIVYVFDVSFRFVTGVFPIGATEFMFNEGIPLEVRLLSFCMHAGTPPVLLWGLARMGYHRRALPLQAVSAAVILAISWFGGPDRNLNWSWGPLFRAQEVVPPIAYLAIAAVGYTVVLYLPSHLVLTLVWPRKGPQPTPGEGASNSC